MYPATGWVTAAAMQATLLPLSEVFGPTIQGEGPHTGRRCYFIRLGLCNLHCSWCDTPYTWDDTRYDVAAECPDTDTETIIQRAQALGLQPGDIVVLSGGEPLIHHQRLPRLLWPQYRWHVETNGTIPPPKWWADRIAHTTLSPKVAQDDDPEKRRLPVKAMERWADHTLRHPDDVAWKFVCRHEADLAYARWVCQEYGVPRPNVWIMPEGRSSMDILRTQRLLAPAVIDQGYNLTTRLHTLLWHDERGH